MSTTSRQNDLVHVDSRLISLESELPKTIPGSLDKDYSLGVWGSQGMLENVLSNEENEKEHPASLTRVV